MDEVLNISIVDYLNEIGIPTRKEGHRTFCSSPFSRDSNWSFCIYPTNTYFDFANGHGGNIVNLYSRINGVSTAEAFKALKEGIKYEKYKPNYKEAKRAKAEIQQPFNYEKYVNTDPKECEQIKAYAASRGITEGFFCGVFFERNDRIREENNENLGKLGESLLKWVLVGWRPVKAFISLFIIFILSIVLLMLRGNKSTFFPSGDPNFIYVYLKLPVGTDVKYTDSVTHILESRKHYLVAENY